MEGNEALLSVGSKVSKLMDFFCEGVGATVVLIPWRRCGGHLAQRSSCAIRYIALVIAFLICFVNVFQRIFTGKHR